MMPVYVAVVGDRSILALHADCHSDAARRIGDSLLRDDLMALASGGAPLWNGIENILVRSAQSDEQSRWDVSRIRAIRRGNLDGDDRGWIAFLVPLDN
jgi:hypothetical protein